MNNMKNLAVYRALGVWEYLLWLFDQVSSTHFSLVAQVKGKVSIKALEQTLHQVQQRHPLLRVRIVVDENNKPWFVEDSAQIPLRVVQRQGDQNWEREVERELGIPFIWTQAPLIRLVIVHSHTISELIVTCYHSIADGLSALYLIRDIFSALVDQDAVPQLEALPLLPPVESLVSSTRHYTALSQVSTLNGTNKLGEEDDLRGQRIQQSIFENSDCHAIPPTTSPAHLCSGSLSPEATQALIRSCKQKQTSVHSAICAAFLMAIHHERNSKKVLTLKCLSPINVRPYLMPVPKEDFGYYASATFSLSTLTSEMDLWDIAYALRDQLNQARAPEIISTTIAQNPTEIYENYNLSNSRNMVEKLSCELAVSNLGCLNIPQQFGELKLQAIYGPVARADVKNEGVVGVATLGNQLFFTLTGSECALSSVELEALKKAAIDKLGLIT